ncbi:MAG TPA: hypothetical protein VGJ16_13905 [Pirellulales bacterium]|jgi:hypothetical protein
MLRAKRMADRWWLVAKAVIAAICFASPTAAAPPWATLVPFKKVEADPKKSYELEEAHGPWMILAATFAGPTAEQQSQDLVLELRQRFRLEAYTFRQSFDFSKPLPSEEVISYSRYGGKRRMRYRNNYKFDEIAVLVGNFPSVNDSQLEKTLQQIKYAKPDTLDPAKRQDSSQRLLGARTIYQMISTNPAKKSKGPMGAAFVTRNPLLPEAYFVAKGIDPFVVEMNKDLPNSLLKCPGRYTVQVATFRGVDTMQPKKFEEVVVKSQQAKVPKIDQAALIASRLCAALRKKGVEAYEFHDRTESMVTVGSFAEVGPKRADGKIELSPAIHRLMKEYGPVEEMKPGTNVAQLYARTLEGIAFDPQPRPVEVPQQSIASTYSPDNSLLR